VVVDLAAAAELVPSEPIPALDFAPLDRGRLYQRWDLVATLCIGSSASAGGGSEVKTQRTLLSIAVAVVAVTGGADASRAEERSAMLSPQILQEIAQVEAEIDRIEAQAIERLSTSPDNQIQQN
jgi:hypothetical protein